MTTSAIPTAADLKALFAAHGIRPSRVRGQNFLVDAALMRRVVEEAELDRRDVALEIGAGTGGLTGCLAEAAGAVVAVEVDRKLHALAAERLAGLPNVRLIHSDVMGPGAALAPEVREAVAAAMDSIPGRAVQGRGEPAVRRQHGLHLRAAAAKARSRARWS